MSPRDFLKLINNSLRKYKGNKLLFNECLEIRRSTAHFVSCILNFSSPLEKKLVTEFPGIGVAGERNLKKKGFEYASQIFGQFLVLEEDEGKFKDWLQRFKIGKAYCRRVYSALEEWRVQYFK